MSDTQPTMRYRPDHVHGAIESEQKPTYFYKVMEGDDVEDCLKDGWFENPDFEKCDDDQSIIILKAAKACYDANRKYCKSIGDDSILAWTKAEEWQRETVIKGVQFLIDKPDAKPEDSHNSWLAEKEADGWKYGEVKDVEKKEHPCFVPYAELPDDQKKKDEIFIATALKALADE